MSISRFITRAEVPNRLFGNIRAGQPELGIYNTPQMQYAADNNNESQNAGAFIPEEETGTFSLGDILADLGRKGVEGFKDVAGRTIKSQAYGGVGTILGGPVVGGIGALAGLLTGGNMFDRSPSQSQITFDNMTPGQQAYTSSLYNPGQLLSGYNQISASGVGALGTLQNRLGNIRNRKMPQTIASKNKINKIQKAIDIINLGGDGGGGGGGYSQSSVDAGVQSAEDDI